MDLLSTALAKKARNPHSGVTISSSPAKVWISKQPVALGHPWLPVNCTDVALLSALGQAWPQAREAEMARQALSSKRSPSLWNTSPQHTSCDGDCCGAVQTGQGSEAHSLLEQKGMLWDRDGQLAEGFLMCMEFRESLNSEGEKVHLYFH